MELEEKTSYSESDLEQALINHLQQFIHELGRDFCFVERQFRVIFQTSKNWTEGMFSLLDWLAENQKRFHSSVGTISRWLGEVTAYFDYRTTSGAVEGINNKLKLIKRSGYGFRNFENFRLRCLICWHLNCSSA